jgi:hypothetical protein
MNPKVPDQLIPTLLEVVPLDGARSISVETLHNDSNKVVENLRMDAQGDYDPLAVNELADAVLEIVHAKLVKILPDLMRDAVEEVLGQEGFLNSNQDR